MSHPRGTSWATWVLATTTAVFALLPAGLWLTARDSRQSIDLAGVADAFADRIGPSTDATDEICQGSILCTQALSSRGAVLMKFDRQDEASAAAASLGGDSRLAGYILMRFEGGELSRDERSSLAATLYCLHVAPDPC